MQVHIGSTQYELIITNDMGHNDESQKYLGTICDWQGEIKIEKTLNQQGKKQTFWHEAVHGMLDEIGANDLSNDEGFVDALGKQIYGFLKKNDIKKIYEKLDA